MYEINHNITKVKLGETICYHIGNLARDRAIREITGEEIVKGIHTNKKTGTTKEVYRIKTIYGELTSDASVTHQVAEKIYLRSTAIWDVGKDRLYGTGEFSIFQKQLGYDKYAYFGKKISNKPVKRP